MVSTLNIILLIQVWEMLAQALVDGKYHSSDADETSTNLKFEDNNFTCA